MIDNSHFVKYVAATGTDLSEHLPVDRLCTLKLDSKEFENFANKHGLKIRASIEGRAVAGVNWKMFGSGPAAVGTTFQGNAAGRRENFEPLHFHKIFVFF